MKTRVNLTIEENLLAHVRVYAAKRGESISEIVESYFSTIIASSMYKNIVDLINELKKPDIDENIDLKKEFYYQY
jgi:hypothetical protein